MRVNIGTWESLTVEMYTKDGEFFREITLHERVLVPYGEKFLVAISNDGRLAVTCKMLRGRGIMVIDI